MEAVTESGGHPTAATVTAAVTKRGGSAAIRDLNNQGYRANQIAEQLGMTEASVRDAFSRLGLKSVERRIGRGRRINLNRVMDEFVATVIPPPVTLELLDGNYARLDGARVRAWESSLSEAITTLTTVRNRLRKELHRDQS